MATSNKGPKRVTTFDVLKDEAFEYETKEWKTSSVVWQTNTHRREAHLILSSVPQAAYAKQWSLSRLHWGHIQFRQGLADFGQNVQGCRGTTTRKILNLLNIVSRSTLCRASRVTADAR
jgi:hypothetical protein